MKKSNKIIVTLLLSVLGIGLFIFLFTDLFFKGWGNDDEPQIEKVGELAFYEVQDYYSFGQDLVDLLEIAPENGIDLSLDLLQTGDEEDILIKEADKPLVDSLLKELVKLNLTPSNVKYCFSAYPKVLNNSDSVKAYRLYPLLLDDKGEASIPKTGFTSVKINHQKYGNEIMRGLDIKMNKETAEAFAKLTRRVAMRFGTLAMVYDNQVYSAPQVASEITGGEVSLSGSIKKGEVRHLKRIIELYIE